MYSIFNKTLQNYIGIQDSCSTSNSIVNESNVNIGIDDKAGMVL